MKYLMAIQAQTLSMALTELFFPLLDQEGVIVCGSVEAAVERAPSFGKTIFCAGGGSIYARMLPLVEEMYLSYIKGNFTGDVYFPEFDEGDWDVAERRDHKGYEFVHYRRKA